MSSKQSTILTPCRVPWKISASTGYITLTYSTTDVSTGCQVELGAGRLTENNFTDYRRIDLTFERCLCARAGWHSDTDTVESLGYRVPDGGDDWPLEEHWKRYSERWRANGWCPDSGFYVVGESPWLTTLEHSKQSSLHETLRKNLHHYVIDGRDGYVELIARKFRWSERVWHLPIDTEASSATLGPIIAEGEGEE
jgi:hypothetical protein